MYAMCGNFVSIAIPVNAPDSAGFFENNSIVASSMKTVDCRSVSSLVDSVSTIGADKRSRSDHIVIFGSIFFAIIVWKMRSSDVKIVAMMNLSVGADKLNSSKNDTMTGIIGGRKFSQNPIVPPVSMNLPIPMYVDSSHQYRALFA